MTNCFANDCEKEATDTDTGLCAAHAREAYQRERMDKITREDAMPALEALCKLSGWSGDGEQAFADAFHRQHRTHQQSIMRMFVRLIMDMSQRAETHGMPNVSDLRNEASYKLAKLLEPTLRRYPLPYL